ncbi:hypothetical protein [Amnibacterium kyonggiense]|uniref:Uncharacterized protein n=1 Tax=Amnibacterium kyonggiense TaxID=595671 RepID=A0A4R7FPH6_9MICO|nr:hypothetical protein [Amnibacterium kyonggiense]TDS79528.1 hypothetical protein CLV52_0057 [Amnibacterium kyonggiense]
MATPEQQPESPLGDAVSCAPAEMLLLGQITGWQLPRPWFDVWLLGRLSLQGPLEAAEAEARRLDALLAVPEPFPVAPLLRTRSFVELSRERGDRTALRRALEQHQRNTTFGQGVA